MFGSAAKRENAELKNRIAQLEQLLANLGGGDIMRMQSYRMQLSQELTQLEQTRQRAAQEFEQMRDTAITRLENLKSEITQLDAEIIDARDELQLQDFGWFEFENPAEASVQLEQALKDTRDRARKLVRDGQATTATMAFTFNNSAREGKNFIKRMSKLALRSYNAEVENAIVKLKEAYSVAREIQSATQDINAHDCSLEIRKTKVGSVFFPIYRHRYGWILPAAE